MISANAIVAPPAAETIAEYSVALSRHDDFPAEESTTFRCPEFDLVCPARMTKSPKRALFRQWLQEEIPAERR